MKIEVVLKPCPWCRKTPDIWMPIEEVTWCWHIRCVNKECHMKPQSPHVSIRKNAKCEFFSFHRKLELLAHTWNGGNPLPPFEIKVVDLSQLPDIDRGAEYLCSRDPWFKRIEAIGESKDCSRTWKVPTS